MIDNSLVFYVFADSLDSSGHCIFEYTACKVYVFVEHILLFVKTNWAPWVRTVIWSLIFQKRALQRLHVYIYINFVHNFHLVHSETRRHFETGKLETYWFNFNVGLTTEKWFFTIIFNQQTPFCPIKLYYLAFGLAPLFWSR